MADTFQVLGQSKPAATTLTAAYTGDSAHEAVVSSIIVCNQSATPTSFRIAISPSAAAIADQHYIAYDTPIGANATISFTLGVGLDPDALVRVYATLATLSFNIFGVLIL